MSSFPLVLALLVFVPSTTALQVTTSMHQPVAMRVALGGAGGLAMVYVGPRVATAGAIAGAGAAAVVKALRMPMQEPPAHFVPFAVDEVFAGGDPDQDDPSSDPSWQGDDALKSRWL